MINIDFKYFLEGQGAFYAFVAIFSLCAALVAGFVILGDRHPTVKKRHAH